MKQLLAFHMPQGRTFNKENNQVGGFMTASRAAGEYNPLEREIRRGNTVASTSSG
jgi:hypothetical protein